MMRLWLFPSCVKLRQQPVNVQLIGGAHIDVTVGNRRRGKFQGFSCSIARARLRAVVKLLQG